MPADSKALLALVAELAHLDEEDLKAILGELEPTARQRLDVLIERYHQGDLTPQPETASAVHLSTWLTDRLAINDHARSTGLTPHASDTLRRIARAHGWSPPPRAEATPAPRRPLLPQIGWGR